MIEILRGVGKRSEDEQLSIVGIERLSALAFNDIAKSMELGVTRGSHLFRRRQECGKPVAVFDEVLPPADAVHVLEQHFHLAPDQQALKSRVVRVHVSNVNFFNRIRLGFDLGKCRLHVGELAREREGKRCDRTFHPLEDVHPQQVDKAFLAVHLPEEALATANLRAVLGVIGRLLVWQHVAQRRVSRECETANFIVDVADGAKLAGKVNVGLDVDGLQSLREAACLVRAVVLLNVLAGTSDGQQVEQLEVVETEHVQETRRLTLGILQSEPSVELELSLANGCLDTGNAVGVQCHIVSPR